MKLVTPHRGGVQRDQDRRVRAELMTSSEEERAMPPDDFNAGAIGQLGTAANAVLVDMRANPAPSEHAWGDPVYRTVYRRLKLRRRCRQRERRPSEQVHGQHWHEPTLFASHQRERRISSDRFTCISAVR